MTIIKKAFNSLIEGCNAANSFIIIFSEIKESLDRESLRKNVIDIGGYDQIENKIMIERSIDYYLSCQNHQTLIIFCLYVVLNAFYNLDPINI